MEKLISLSLSDCYKIVDYYSEHKLLPHGDINELLEILGRKQLNKFRPRVLEMEKDEKRRRKEEHEKKMNEPFGICIYTPLSTDPDDFDSIVHFLFKERIRKRKYLRNCLNQIYEKYENLLPEESRNRFKSYIDKDELDMALESIFFTSNAMIVAIPFPDPNSSDWKRWKEDQKRRDIWKIKHPDIEYREPFWKYLTKEGRRDVARNEDLRRQRENGKIIQQDLYGLMKKGGLNLDDWLPE